MRVLRVNSVTMEIGASHEADWPRLAAAALLAVREGREVAPAVGSGQIKEPAGSSWFPSAIR